VIILAAVLLPVILKRELAELAWVSVVLFSSLGLFIVLCFYMLVFDPRFEGVQANSEFWSFKIEWSTISALSVTMLAYSFQQNTFPIFSELRVKTNAEFKMTNITGLTMTIAIYLCVATLGLFMFGSKLTEASSVLINIGDLRTPDGGAYWEAIIVQVSFMLVLMCHIPFIYFSGKDALCTMVDEVDRKSISSALWHKLQGNEHFEKTGAPEPPNPHLPIPAPGNNRNSYSSMVVDVNNTPATERMRRSKAISKSMMSHVSAAVA
jgi:hypothetical protein